MIVQLHCQQLEHCSLHCGISFYKLCSMDEIITAIKSLVQSFCKTDSAKINILPQSGSDRIYFRVSAGHKSYIATYNRNVKENETFIYFSNHFADGGLPVPKIYAVNNERTVYIQEDFGDVNLFGIVERKQDEATYKLYQRSLSELSRLQILGDKGLDYEQCFAAKEFDKQAVLNDLLYFKYYFLDTLKLPYDKQVLSLDFETLSNRLNNPEFKYFMFRDFQSRNIMVKDGNVHFIDYQGGMKGALQYDVASLLWQAKANLSGKWKASLLEHYIGETEKNLGRKINRELFISQYNGFVLLRLLQVLGAYGFRGLFERKSHFISSIPFALRNLKFFIENNKLDADTPGLCKVLDIIISDEIVAKFETTKADENTPLVVKICSFSYRQGCPADDTENGGGFVFDMRGILNPGRFKEYKQLTGRDKEVIDFLEHKTKMNEFLNSAFNVVDIAVEDYIRRGFASLMVSFGCTGGQHRSVYAADALAKHLKDKFEVKIQLCHVVQEAKNWVNE